MNIFELVFFAGLLWLLFLLSRWVGNVAGISAWLVFPLLAAVVFSAMATVAHWRDKHHQDRDKSPP
jgi:hypothetical protein